MISQKFNESKKPGLTDMVASVFYETAEDVLKEQAGILKTYYNKRSGDTLSNLTGRNFDIMKSSRNVKMIINYINSIRFLDLKKTATGKKKRLYHPIYNRPLYGYIYNFTYPKLSYGLMANIRERTVEPLKAVLTDPIEVQP
jgi:hypothetical protein